MIKESEYQAAVTDLLIELGMHASQVTDGLSFSATSRGPMYLGVQSFNQLIPKLGHEFVLFRHHYESSYGGTEVMLKDVMTQRGLGEAFPERDEVLPTMTAFKIDPILDYIRNLSTQLNILLERWAVPVTAQNQATLLGLLLRNGRYSAHADTSTLMALPSIVQYGKENVKALYQEFLQNEIPLSLIVLSALYQGWDFSQHKRSWQKVPLRFTPEEATQYREMPFSLAVELLLGEYGRDEPSISMPQIV
jgi:hypothetical protein